MDINKCIKIIENSIKDPTKGLPEDIFLFLTRLSPLINVDLLIKNPQNQTLLTWRQAGQSYGQGWHVPGGIVRYKEKISNRVHAVAKSELKTKVIFDAIPLAVNEILLKQINRGHFISLLYSCKLIQDPDINLKHLKGTPKIGEWAWHDSCPDTLIFPHKMVYKNYI